MKTIHMKNWSDRPYNFTGIAIDQNGDKAWYQSGKFHRLDGPAIECTGGDKEYYQDDKLHKIDGPAIEYTNGYKAYYQNGKRHRTDGPAVEWPNGYKEWWIKGEKTSKKAVEVLNILILKNLKPII